MPVLGALSWVSMPISCKKSVVTPWKSTEVYETELRQRGGSTVRMGFLRLRLMPHRQKPALQPPAEEKPTVQLWRLTKGVEEHQWDGSKSSKEALSEQTHFSDIHCDGMACTLTIESSLITWDTRTKNAIVWSLELPRTLRARLFRTKLTDTFTRILCHHSRNSGRNWTFMRRSQLKQNNHLFWLFLVHQISFKGDG